MADRYGVGLHIHLSETSRDVQHTVGRYGVRPVKYLHSLGILGDPGLPVESKRLRLSERWDNEQIVRDLLAGYRPTPELAAALQRYREGR